MYIADGDYIRDIEVNDLRNRYTLTKGSTQKMVNTPLCQCPLIFSAIHQTSFSRLFILIALLTFYAYTLIFFVGVFKLTGSGIALTASNSLASADSRCVTSRSRKKPALVRYTYKLRFR